MIDASPAGTVEISFNAGSLSLVQAVANDPWVETVEHAAGREIEVTFRNGSLRIDVKAELEDGEIKVRVLDRAVTGDDDSGSSHDDDGDHSSGHHDDDPDDDDSGHHDSGHDDDDHDDHDDSGHHDDD